MNKLTFIKLIALGIALCSHASFATILNPMTCTYTDIDTGHVIKDGNYISSESAVLTSVVVVGDDTKTNKLSQTYGATGCAGVYLEHNDDQSGASDPYPNIGQLGDGILNGGLLNSVQVMDGMEFIEVGDLQNLDGTKNDPGWVHLAEYMTYDDKDKDGQADKDFTIDYSTVGSVSFDIGELLTLTLGCLNGYGDLNNGCTSLNWTLTTEPTVIEDAQAILGAATFDHLAFSVKAGNAFAVYDFNFTDIFAKEEGVNFLTPYILSGSINTQDFPNDNNGLKAISHLNVWARDPADVPEPTTIALMGLSLILLVSRRK